MKEWAITLHDKVIKRFTISEGDCLTIGRGNDADVLVDNTAISRKHTSLELRDGVYYVSDLGSLNGTFVNGSRVEVITPVSENDSIQVGKFTLAAADNLPGGQDYDSFSTPMDIEDETVFISAKQASALRNKGPIEKKSHTLTLITGQASPDSLSLEGKSSIKIGKDPTSDMIISGFLVAAAQFYIILRDANYYIIPQSSWTATKLNGNKIKEEQILRKGDIIEVRSMQIRFD